ncbi:MAG: hypothetical protein HOI03_03020 [Candidatus Marinimicrobia bacterium]|nr:hypothetical protein [Candidatus Neomarinimicrobiota bacterium]
MNLLSNTLKSTLAFLLSFSLFFVTGCEDDDHDEDHTDADGFILEDASGNELYREFEGAVTGSVALGVNDTLELSVHFLDDEGNEMEHEEEEGDGLAVSGADASIAIVEVESHEEEEEEGEHGNAIHIIGVSAGSTSFQLQLMHDGHADYTSTNNVTVTVQ